MEDLNSHIIQERKEKLLKLFVHKRLLVWIFLGLALILGVYIRSLPMTDHGGNPGLWDITKNSWTLGPDLDPYLFVRLAETIVNTGSFPDMDMMRNVPLGFHSASESMLLPYMISYTYYFVKIFVPNATVYFAGVIFPVIMFALTILSFFFFVREVFITEEENENVKLKAEIIALISTFFMIVMPAFLSRTIAGIPEKESAGFFFMFLAFFLFLRAWKSKRFYNSLMLGIGAGMSTGIMGLIWGGVSYIFVTIALSTLVAFILNKINRKEIIVYFCWIFVSYSSLILFSDKYTLGGLIASMSSGSAFLVLFILITHLILWNPIVSGKLRVLHEIKLPRNMISIIVAIIVGLLGALIFFGPGFIFEKLDAFNQMMFRPVVGRWQITVAENKQPYFTEWGASFGPFVKNIPVLFWLFFMGSVVLFRKMLNKIKKQDAWILTAIYIFFFLGLVFSRYAAHPSIFDGENFLSKSFYYLGFILLGGSLVYYVIKYQREENEGFKLINYESIFLFSLFILCLFTARSAVRLIMVLAPIAPIFVGYFLFESIEQFRKSTKDDTRRILFGVLIFLLIISSVFVFWNFYNATKSQAYYFIPGPYNQQWQEAMSWVRTNTTQDAVFAHWWDYGYWLQSIGNRATVTDGGNAIVWWNYLTGRLVLTGDNQKDSLNFLKSHNASYLLIDSSDIGKYTAFSSIGSDENYDRYSWIPTFLSDQSTIQETKTGITRVFEGGTMIDEDIYYNDNGTQLNLLKENTYIAGITLDIEQIIPEGENVSKGVILSQPVEVFISSGKQIRIPLRYVFFKGKLKDFGTGINGTLYIIDRIIQSSQGVKKDDFGAAMYISPRVMRGYLAQKYLLNDPFGNFPNFNLAYNQESLMVKDLNNYGLNVGEFVYFNDLNGPIKIWSINYTGKEEIKPEYLDTDSKKYLSWDL